MKYNWLWKRLVKWLSAFDPAMDRSQEDLELEQVAKEVAMRFGLEFVKQAPVVGVNADIVIERQGLPLCGITNVEVTGVPKRVMARAIETHIRQLTQVDWEFKAA